MYMLGTSASNEACLEAATAPLIGLMDADDRGEPQRFSRLLEASRSSAAPRSRGPNSEKNTGILFVSI